MHFCHPASCLGWRRRDQHQSPSLERPGAPSGHASASPVSPGASARRWAKCSTSPEGSDAAAIDVIGRNEGRPLRCRCRLTLHVWQMHGMLRHLGQGGWECLQVSWAGSSTITSEKGLGSRFCGMLAKTKQLWIRTLFICIWWIPAPI